MDDTDHMIKILSETVNELKRGIMEYSSMSSRLGPAQQQQAQLYIKEMHQVALRLQNGIDGLNQLKVLKTKLSGR